MASSSTTMSIYDAPSDALVGRITEKRKHNAVEVIPLAKVANVVNSEKGEVFRQIGKDIKLMSGSLATNDTHSRGGLNFLHTVRILMNGYTLASFYTPSDADPAAPAPPLGERCSHKAAGEYIQAVEQNLRLNEQFGNLMLPELQAIEAKNREEWARYMRENNGATLSEAIEIANVRLMSMWPSIARYREALVAGKRPAVPVPPTSTKKQKLDKAVTLTPDDNPPQKAVCQRYLLGQCRRTNCKRAHPEGKFGSAKK